MFYKDTNGKMDVADPVAEDDDASKVLKARYAFTKGCNKVDMMGPIHSDIFFQIRLMLNGVNLIFKPNRSNSVSSPSQSGFFFYSGTCSCFKTNDCQVPFRRTAFKDLSTPTGFQ